VDRRDIVKLITLGSTLPLLPNRSLALFRGIHANLSTSPKLKIFNAHQDATVTAMAELILPQTDTPGAKAARVNEFIDLIVADWYSEEDRTFFLAGIADVDARTQSLFKKDFVDASLGEKSEILRGLGEQLAKENAALASAPIGYRGSTAEPEQNFYFMLRGLTLTGYFTSEVGFTQQLREEIIPGRFDGCVPMTTHEPGKGS
jgi:hypothetical protein